MLGGADVVIFSLLHLVAVHGTTIAGDQVQIVNNTDLASTLRHWPEIYRYRGVPNVTSYYVITSPGFPGGCCNKSETTITASVIDGKRQHLFLICTDYDIPERTHLIFWTGSNTFVPLPNGEGGHRSRPISWLPRGYLKVDLNPLAVRQTDRHTGYRCLVWETSKDFGFDEWLPRPSSDCSRVDTSQPSSGVVDAGVWPSKLSNDFYYDCTWQLKVPVLPDSAEDWQVFVYVTKMDVDGLVEIREGLDSTAPLLATNRKDPAPNYRDLSSLKQPPGGFVSKQGLFVKLIKPYYEGEFKFTYGSFALQSVPSANRVSDYTVLDTGRSCTLRMNKTYSMKGFLCNSTQRCIPHRYACDGVHHCTDGSDEGDFCSEAFFGGYDSLFSDCQAGQRTCQSGVCVIASVRCPEDPCPDDRPHKCDSDYMCFGPREMCDGENHCEDGADEDCSKNYDFTHIYPILGAICGACAIIIIVCVAIWFWRRKRLRRGGNSNAEGVTNPGSDVPMMDVPSRNFEQEALIYDDNAPTPPDGYEDSVNQETDHDSTTSLTRDHN